MVNQFSTLARLDGLAVLIIGYGAMFTQVRYVGHKGRQIRKDAFTVETQYLTQY